MTKLDPAELMAMAVAGPDYWDWAAGIIHLGMDEYQRRMQALHDAAVALVERDAEIARLSATLTSQPS